MNATITPLARQGDPDDTWEFMNEEPSANWRPGQRRMRVRKSLTELAAVAGELDAAMAAAVANLRQQGQSWGAIARALGVTRQAAYERFAARVEGGL